MTIQNMTTSELLNAEKRYDLGNNEGGEGCNPYSDELERRDHESEQSREKSLKEQEQAIVREISKKDCSIARESGTFDQTEIDTLRTALNDIRAKMELEFFAEWTREVTSQRRHTWNSAMAETARRGKKVNLLAAEIEHGFTMDALKKAVNHYQLPKWTA